MKVPRIPSARQLWARHEELILEVLDEALLSLRQSSILPASEDEISREFYFCLRAANVILLKKGRGLRTIPCWQGQNQPLSNSKKSLKHDRENKRPDFQWQLYDDLENRPDLVFRHFTIECKRLGLPSRSWVFNENYVREGVLRFIKEDYGYGDGTESGAMIGYVQSMALEDILAEVNTCATMESVSCLILSKSGWKKGGVSRLDHTLVRPKVLPTRFDLRHLWVDLRTSY